MSDECSSGWIEHGGIWSPLSECQDCGERFEGIGSRCRFCLLLRWVEAEAEAEAEPIAAAVDEDELPTDGGRAGG